MSLSNMRGLVLGATAAITGGLIGRGIKGLVTAGADLETVVTEFKVLTGSIETATELVDRMRQFTAKTPLQFEDVSEGSKRLMAFGIETENVLDVMGQLGDAALGDAEKLNSLTRAYGKVAARGKASMEEVNMVIDAGVPIMDALNDVMGTNTEQLQDMMRNGEVTADIFQEAFRSMTSEGGQFFGGMSQKARTQAGLFSTLKDNISIVAQSIGGALLPTTKALTEQIIEVTGRINEWVTENQDLIKQGVDDTLAFIKDTIRDTVSLVRALMPLIKSLVAGYLAWKAVTLVLNAALMVQQGILAVQKFAQLVRIIGQIIRLNKGWVAIQSVLNVVMTANPIGLVITAIAALIGVVALLVKHWDKVKAALMSAWEWFSKLLDNPLIAAAATVFAPFLAIPALIMKHWGPIKDFLSGVGDALNRAADFLGFSGGGGEDFRSGRYGPTSPNTGVISSNTTRTERSEVALSFNNMPGGTTVSQSGRARGVSIDYGKGRAGL